MPKQYFNQDYMVPFRGINTEANPLAFPEGFCADALNVEIDYNPLRVQPRKGLKPLAGFITVDDYGNTVTGDEDAINTFLWYGVDEDPSKEFIAMQVGLDLFFFEGDLSNNIATFNMAQHLAGNKSGDQARKENLDFTIVKGSLVVLGNSTIPLLFQYDDPNINVSEIKIKIRDVYGVDDGLFVSERPNTLSDEHKYNLQNQGWYENIHTGGGTEQEPIEHFNTVVGDYPSNADNISVGIVEGVDGDAGRRVFKPNYLKDFEVGNSPAPKGHWIVDPFYIDRAGILLDPTLGQDKTGGNLSGGGLPDSNPTPNNPGDNRPFDPDFPDYILP